MSLGTFPPGSRRQPFGDALAQANASNPFGAPPGIIATSPWDSQPNPSWGLAAKSLRGFAAALSNETGSAGGVALRKSSAPAVHYPPSLPDRFPRTGLPFHPLRRHHLTSGQLLQLHFLFN